MDCRNASARRRGDTSGPRPVGGVRGLSDDGMGPPGQELRLAIAEGPVRVGVLHDVPHQVGGRQAAGGLEFGAELSVEVDLLHLRPRPRHDLQHHHLVGPGEPEAGILDPLPVTVAALEAAVSAAGVALTSDVLIHHKNPSVSVQP